MTAIIMDAHVGAELVAMLRRAFSPYAAKIAAPYADASYRTVERWLQGRARPPAEAVLRMARHEAFRAELRAWCDRCEQEERAIRDRLEQLENTRAGVVRNALDRTRSLGAGARRSGPAAARSAVAVTR